MTVKKCPKCGRIFFADKSPYCVDCSKDKLPEIFKDIFQGKVSK